MSKKTLLFLASITIISAFNPIKVSAQDNGVLTSNVKVPAGKNDFIIPYVDENIPDGTKQIDNDTTITKTTRWRWQCVDDECGYKSVAHKTRKAAQNNANNHSVIYRHGTIVYKNTNLEKSIKNDDTTSANPKKNKWHWKCLNKNCGYTSIAHKTKEAAANNANNHTVIHQHDVRVYNTNTQR